MESKACEYDEISEDEEHSTASESEQEVTKYKESEGSKLRIYILDSYLVKR